jgi:hypothetical protein
MNLKEHADALASLLEIAIESDDIAGTLLADEAEREISYYRETVGVEWVKAPDVCEALQISRRTLVRWRQENRIEAGKHWRRMGEGSHCLYDLRALEQQMNDWAK